MFHSVRNLNAEKVREKKKHVIYEIIYNSHTHLLPLFLSRISVFRSLVLILVDGHIITVQTKAIYFSIKGDLLSEIGVFNVSQ